MYAVIETGGKQYMVREGDVLRVEKITDADKAVTFPVLAIGEEGKKFTYGTPVLEKASVSATVLGDGRDKKITVYKMKTKKRYRVKQGHRQSFTEVKIDKITG